MEELLAYHKRIHDNIHGSIKLSKLATLIVDTPEFQRLRELHQLGTCHFVYPTATHTRFEHSLGTYHLTGKMLDSVIKNSDIHMLNEWLVYGTGYELNPFVCELVKIAGLIHDLGHGPFSHLFDDQFIPTVRTTKDETDYHEIRSVKIFKNIVSKNSVLNDVITDKCINFVNNLINPDPSKHTGFIYQIVSNCVNSIDVDKFDYILRDGYMLGIRCGFDYLTLIDSAKVLDNKICFPEQLYYEVVSIFKSRYRLHKQVYNHKASMAVEYMINDIMLELNDVLNVYDSVKETDTFIKLTDSYITTMITFMESNIGNYHEKYRDNIQKAYSILNRINCRDLYIHIGTMVSEKCIDIDKYFSEFPTDKIIIYKTKLGFVSGKKSNPLDNLYFYTNKKPELCHKVDKKDVSYMISDQYQEFMYMVFCKDRTDNTLVQKLICTFNSLSK